MRGQETRAHLVRAASRTTSRLHTQKAPRRLGAPAEQHGFSYVGACQVLMGVYIFFSRGLSRLVHSRVLFLKDRSERPTAFFLGSDLEAPRGAQSAIRAQEDCLRPMKFHARATTPIHAHGLWTLSPWPKNQPSYRPSSFTPRSRSSIVTRPGVFGKVLLS